MRWRDVPYMSGMTHPEGSVSSPYAGLGIMGPLRLAVGQPPLVGEDLHQVEGFHAVAKPTTPPNDDDDGGSTGTDPDKDEPPDYPTLRFSQGGPFRPQQRFAESAENRPRPGARFGPPPYGGTAQEQREQDADFSCSPLEIGPQASNQMNGYAGTLIASNHYGDFGQAVPGTEKRRSAPAAIADVLETLRQAGKEAGLDTAAAISVREGIPVSEAAIEVISTRGMGAPELKRRIANLQAKYRVARSKKQRYRAKDLRVRIAALKARLRDVQSGRVQAVADMSAIAGDSTRVPPWVAYAGVGLGVASLAVALLSLNKGKKK